MQTWEPSYYHHPVEDIEPAPDHSCSNAATATAQLFDSFVADNFRQTPRGLHHDAQPLFRRFLALLWVLDPDRYFEGRTERQVADYIGITRSAFSRIVCEFKDRLGVRNRYMKREGAIPVYKARQERIWSERAANKVTSEAQMYLNVVCQ